MLGVITLQNMDSKLTLAERYRMARKDCGLSQAEAARRIGIKPASLCQIENGTTKSVKDTTGIRAADLYNVNRKWLTYGVGQRQRDTDQAFKPATRNILLGTQRRHRLAAVVAALQSDQAALDALYADIDGLISRWEIITRPKRRTAKVVPFRTSSDGQ